MGRKSNSVDLVKLNLNKFAGIASPIQQLEFLADVIGKLRGCRRKLAKLHIKSKDFKYWVHSVEMWEGVLYACSDHIEKEKNKPHALAQGAIDTLQSIMKRGEEVSHIISGGGRNLGKTITQIMKEQGVDPNLITLANEKGQ